MRVVKAQIHSGGRGAAGGVKLCRSGSSANSPPPLFGRQLVTKPDQCQWQGVYRL
ncbi:MAG: ATP-grasp domain-containing protein [Paracoccaceae bacterium]